MLKNEHGFSAIECIFVLALVAIALTWFRYDQPNKADDRPLSAATIETPTR